MKHDPDNKYSIECGYEAGCLGYTLYHQLTGAGIKCVILVPTTMLTQKLGCFLGIRTHTALSLIVETGDFKRFAKGNTYAAFLGLAPGEHSGSENVNRLGISKARNTHLRCLLIEAAKGICKGAIGHKSKELRTRQSGQPAEVMVYADKANTQLRSKYYKMIRHGKKKNVAVTAVARELACFVWGMMTGNISISPTAGTSMPAARTITIEYLSVSVRSCDH